jgi:hypothetical protein
MAFTTLTCAACSTCLQPYCCNQINACLADTSSGGGCAGELSCVLNCYNGTTLDGGAVPDGGGDMCASNCQLMNWGPNAANLYMAQDMCQSNGMANTVCNGAAVTAPCNCNGGDDGGSGDDGGGSSSGSDSGGSSGGDAAGDGPTE